MKQVDWEESRGQRKQTTHDDTGNNDSPPQTVHVHGVKDAGHLLMLENYQEFNAALIIAAGGEKSLSPSAPRPAEFVCDEVARSSLHKSRTIVADEAGALEFFRGPLWNRRFGKKAEDDEAEEGEDVGAEEKKMEEQLAR